MFKTIIKSLTTDKLKKKEIIDICKIKNSFWKYGLKNNLEWFKKNIKEKDIHNIIYYKKKILGYNMLRKRIFFLNNKKKSYLYFDTLIIHPKYRKLELAKKLCNFNIKIINKKKLHAFLICQNKLCSFYEKFKWKKINLKEFIIKDHKFLRNKFSGMIFKKIKNPMRKRHKYYLNKT